MKNKDFILLLDRDTYYGFQEKPESTKNIIKDFEVICCNDLSDDYKELIIKDGSSPLGKKFKDFIEEKDVLKFLVESPVYNNVYYPMWDFENLCIQDTNQAMMDVFSKMGAIELIFGKEDVVNVENHEATGSGGGVNTEFKHPNDKKSQQYNSKNQSEVNYVKSTFSEISKRYANGERREIHRENFSQEELRNFIDRGGINLDSFGLFKDDVLKYLKSGVSPKIIEFGSSLEQKIININRVSGNIKAGINILKKVKLEFFIKGDLMETKTVANVKRVYRYFKFKDEADNGKGLDRLKFFEKKDARIAKRK